MLASDGHGRSWLELRNSDSRTWLGNGDGYGGLRYVHLDRYGRRRFGAARRIGGAEQNWDHERDDYHDPRGRGSG